MRVRLVGIVSLALMTMTAMAWANPVNVTFTNTTSNLGGPTQNVYYYPYVLTVNGTTMTVACDDFNDDAHLGSSWVANESTLANLSGTMFYNGGSGVNLYHEAAWLYDQFLPTPPLTDSVNAAINIAIWDLFTPGSMNQNQIGSNQETSSNYWLTQAALHSNYSDADFVIFTPTSWPTIGDGDLDDRPQEYIGEVPEPAPALLLLSGSLGLGLWLAGRRTASAQA